MTQQHIPTLNSMGYMTTVIDPYTQQFIEYCHQVSGPVADLGVAFGHTTQALLKTGAHVVANDICQAHLDALVKTLSPQQRDKLTLLPGKLPEVFELADDTLSGVLAARCLHFFTGEEIEALLQRIYHSLIPGGKCCVIAETPYMHHTSRFIPVFEYRKARGELWPGYIEHFKLYTNRANTTDRINLMHPDILQRCFQEAGFDIEQVGFIARPYFPPEVRLNGQESVGIIGVKPS